MDVAITRRLDAIDYPHRDGFRCEDLGAVRELTVWLEDRIIRFHKIEDRAYLRVPGDAFRGALDQYLKHLGKESAAWTTSAPQRAVIALLGHAIGLLYEESAETLGSSGAVDAAACYRELQEACRAVGVEPPASASLEDVSTCMARLRLAVETRRAGPGAAGAAVASSPRVAASGAATGGAAEVEAIASRAAVDHLPMTFSTGDVGVDRAARLLYVLYVEDMRRLQDQVNACLSTAQEFTADPKTNATLGKVGR